MKKLFLKTLMTTLVLLTGGVSSAWADEITATLDHTGSSSRDGSNTTTTTVDSEKEHYNNTKAAAWGGWAYAQFSFEIPEGQAVKSATLKWATTIGGTEGRNRDNSIYYMDVGTTIAWESLTSGTSLNLTGNGTLITTVSIKAGSENNPQTTDVTDAVKAIIDGSQTYIIFEWTNNAAGADLYGKGSSQAPTLVIETASASSQTQYTVKYTDGTNELKESKSYDIIIGESFSASDNDMQSFVVDGRKWIYESGNSSMVSVADAASNIVTLVFREAATYNYLLTSSLGKTIVSGSDFEGETLNVGYPHYIVDNNILYVAETTNKEYRKSIALTEDNVSVVVDYTPMENVNVVYYSEAEDIEGMTTSTTGNLPIRGSNAMGAVSTEDVTITTLPVGKYKIHVGTFTSRTNSQTIYIGYGETQIGFSSASNLNESASEEIVLTESTDIKYFGTTSSGDAQFDYVWIEKTGDLEDEALATAKEELQIAIAYAESIEADELADAIGTAQAAYDAEDATAESVSQATAALVLAVKQYAKGALQTVLDLAEEMSNNSGELDEEIQEFKTELDGAIEAANAALDDDEKTPEEIMTALDELSNAALVFASVTLDAAIEAAKAIDTEGKNGAEELAAAIQAAEAAFAEESIQGFYQAGLDLKQAIDDFNAANEPTFDPMTVFVNPDFEGEYEVHSKPQDNRAIYKPDGWTVTYENGDVNDMSALNEKCLQWNDNFQTKPQPTNGGNNTYWIRYRWGSSSRLVLSQPVTLPAGKYSLTADAFFNGKGGGAATISAAGVSKNVNGNSTWANYELEFTLASETEVTIAFGLTQTSAIEVLAAFDNFKLTYTEVVVKDNLEKAIAIATKVYNGTSDATLGTAITNAQAVFDNESATQKQVNDATATLNEAVATCVAEQSDYTFFITNPGFEQSEATEGNKATGSAVDYTSTGWSFQTSNVPQSCGAVLAYGNGQVNGNAAPATDLEGNSGNALGISVGWSQTVTYQSADAVTLPAGDYVLLAYVYNANNDGQNFTSKLGFVPTTGAPILTSTTSFASGKWSLDYVEFTLGEATEGKFQIGGVAGNSTSGSHAKIFIDNLTLTNADGLALAQSKVARPNWLAAKAAAQDALANADYANVKGSEKIALENEDKKDEPTTAEGYDEATAALISATNAFTAAKTSYDLFVEYNKELPYAPNVQPEITDESTAEGLISELRAYYESNALAEGYKGAEDVTATYLTNYVNPENIDGWTVNNTTGNSNMRIMTNEPYTNVDESEVKGYFDSNSWGTAFATTFTQDVKLPMGKYILTAKARGNGTTTYKVIAGENSTDVTAIGNTGGVFGRGWNDFTVEFELVAEKTVTLGMQMETGSSSNWLSFSDFRLVRIGDSEVGLVLAEANDLAAADDAVAVGKLRDAIAAYEDGGEIAALQTAVDQFKVDNADQEKDETAKVATNGWKKFDGNDTADLAPDWAAPSITTYDGRTAQPAEVYEGTVQTTGTIIYQNITGLTKGSYKVGFYGNAAFTSGRGFDSDVQEGDDDVAYVFANDKKAFVNAHIATSISAYELLEFNVEVTDGNIKLGMGKEKAGTNWHTMQIYRLTWFTTAKAVYAQDKEDMSALIAEAQALAANEYKTEGKDDLNTAIEDAQTALENNKLNLTEFEAEIQALQAAIEAFVTANLVTVDGKFYVQHATTGKAIAAGHNYGTRGIVTETGLDLYLGYDETTRKVYINTFIGGETNHFLGSNLYMDSPSYDWMVEQTGEDTYSISDGKQFISVDADDNLVMSDTPADWKFIAEDAYIENKKAALSEATAENGMDATFLLLSPNFNRDDWRTTFAWAISSDCTNYNLNGGNQVNNCAESYHSLFTISQTIENAPAGIYKMTAQGFYRQDDGATEDVPLFFAGNKTAEVPVMGELPDHDGNNRESMGDASVEFTNGNYTIDPIEFIVGENGELTVGVSGTAVHQWVIFDNFQLTYYGPAPETPVTLAVTDAKWATFVAPFDVAIADIPEGVTAYTVDGIGENSELTLTPVTTTIPANTPVVLNSDEVVEETVTGVADWVENPTGGTLLTGVYAETAVPVGSYVLQNHDGTVAFYVVQDIIPKVQAYHAYMTIPSGDGARAYYLNGEATAISTLKALTSGDAEIYDLNGRRQVKLQKGVNIIRTKDGRTQKVMVK